MQIRSTGYQRHFIRILVRRQVHGAHVGSAGAERGHERDAVAEGAGPEDLGQDVLERAVTAIDDQQVDVEVTVMVGGTRVSGVVEGIAPSDYRGSVLTVRIDDRGGVTR